MMIEEEIRSIPGVVGAAMIEDESRAQAELEVFISRGVDPRDIRQAIEGILTTHGRMQSMGRISVHELSREESKPEIHLTGEARPSIRHVSVASSSTDATASLAHVNLVWEGYESEGTGTARRTSHGLRLVAATTLESIQAFVGRKGLFSLDSASLVEVMERQVVMVIVSTGRSTYDLSVGAALVREAPIYDAAVRATLDAVNRRLAILASNDDRE
ncbi:MAG: hypothetical protein ABIS18_07730 [Actinomycetota bacterium]